MPTRNQLKLDLASTSALVGMYDIARDNTSEKWLYNKSASWYKAFSKMPARIVSILDSNKFIIYNAETLLPWIEQKRTIVIDYSVRNTLFSELVSNSKYMLWSNLKMFLLGGNYSIVVFDFISDRVFAITPNSSGQAQITHAYLISNVFNSTSQVTFSGNLNFKLPVGGTIIPPQVLYDNVNTWLVFGVNTSSGGNIVYLGPFTEKTDINKLDSIVLPTKKLSTLASDGTHLAYTFENDPKIYIRPFANRNRIFIPDKMFNVDLSQIEGIHGGDIWNAPITNETVFSSLAITNDVVNNTLDITVGIDSVDKGGVVHLRFNNTWNITNKARIVPQIQLQNYVPSEYEKIALPFSNMSIKDLKFIDNNLWIAAQEKTINDTTYSGGATILSFTPQGNTFAYTTVKTYMDGTVIDAKLSPWYRNHASKIFEGKDTVGILGDGFVWCESAVSTYSITDLQTRRVYVDSADIQWQVSMAGIFEKFDVLLSTDGQTFNVIDTINSVQNAAFYSIRISNLLPSTKYYVKIRGSLGTGMEVVSNVIDFTTDTALPTPTFTVSSIEDTCYAKVGINVPDDSRVVRAEVFRKDQDSETFIRIGYLNTKLKLHLAQSAQIGDDTIKLTEIPVEVATGTSIKLREERPVDTDNDGILDVNVIMEDAHTIKSIDLETNIITLDTPLAASYTDGATVTVDGIAYIDRATYPKLAYQYKVRFVDIYGQYSESSVISFTTGEKSNLYRLIHATEGWRASYNLPELLKQGSLNGAFKLTVDNYIQPISEGKNRLSDSITFYSSSSITSFNPNSSYFNINNQGIKLAKILSSRSNSPFTDCELYNFTYDNSTGYLVSTAQNPKMIYKKIFNTPTYVETVSVSASVSPTPTKTVSLPAQPLTYIDDQGREVPMYKVYLNGNEVTSYSGTGTCEIVFTEPILLNGGTFGYSYSTSSGSQFVSFSTQYYDEQDKPVTDFPAFIKKISFNKTSATANISALISVIYGQFVLTVNGEEQQLTPVSTNVIDTNLDVKREITELDISFTYTNTHLSKVHQELAKNMTISTTVRNFVPGVSTDNSQTITDVPYIIFQLPISFSKIDSISLNAFEMFTEQNNKVVGYLTWAVSFNKIDWYTRKNDRWYKMDSTKLTTEMSTAMTSNVLTRLTAEDFEEITPTNTDCTLYIACGFVATSTAYSPRLFEFFYDVAVTQKYPSVSEIITPPIRETKFTKCYDIIYTKDEPIDRSINKQTQIKVYYSYSTDNGRTWSDWQEYNKNELRSIEFWKTPHSNLMKFRIVFNSYQVCPTLKSLDIYFLDVDRVPQIIRPQPGEPIIDGQLDLIFTSPENLTGGTVQFAIEIAKDANFTNILSRERSFLESRDPFKNFTLQDSNFSFCTNYIIGTNPDYYIWTSLGTQSPSKLGIPGINGAPADGITVVRYKKTLTSSDNYYIRIYTWDGTIGR